AIDQHADSVEHDDQDGGDDRFLSHDVIENGARPVDVACFRRAARGCHELHARDMNGNPSALACPRIEKEMQWRTGASPVRVCCRGKRKRTGGRLSSTGTASL